MKIKDIDKGFIFLFFETSDRIFRLEYDTGTLVIFDTTKNNVFNKRKDIKLSGSIKDETVNYSVTEDSVIVSFSDDDSSKYKITIYYKDGTIRAEKTITKTHIF